MIVAEVFLWNTRIGVVAKNSDNDYTTFRYDDDFLRSNIELSPIVMPLAPITYEFNTLSLESFQGLPGLLSDSLPDRYGNRIIEAWLEKQGRSLKSFSVIEKLCYIGSRGMGALEYRPSNHGEFNELNDIELSNLVELSNDIVNNKKNISSRSDRDIRDIIKVGTSAGGARAKAIVAINEKTGEIKSGQIDAGKDFTYWIIKLDGIKQPLEETSFTRREYAYYLMARDAKINMSESRLIEKDGYYHFMTKRFDRVVDSSGVVHKLHVQTLAALTHTDYNIPGLMSYERITNIMYDLGLKYEEHLQFYRRMVFNVMARNQDDHVKNTSFIMNRRGEWSLSPAYDITYSFNPEGQWTSVHQMTINGKNKDFTKEDLLNSAKNMRITYKDALLIIDEVKQSISKFQLFAKEAKLGKEETSFISNQFFLFN